MYVPQGVILPPSKQKRVERRLHEWMAGRDEVAFSADLQVRALEVILAQLGWLPGHRHHCGQEERRCKRQLPLGR